LIASVRIGRGRLVKAHVRDIVCGAHHREGLISKGVVREAGALTTVFVAKHSFGAGTG
jgi:hypothetical protein